MPSVLRSDHVARDRSRAALEGSCLLAAAARLHRVLAVLLVGLVVGTAAAAVFPGAAAAKTVTWTYDFADSSFGNQAWRPDNAPPGNVPGGPWYSTTFTPGQGLRIVPAGNGGADYHDARGTWWLYAPTGSTVTRVRLEGLNGKAFAGQLGRVWLASLNPDPQPRPASVQRELIASGSTWNDQALTLTPPVGTTAGGFGLWLFTRPCTVAAGDCKPADPADGAFVSLRKLVMTIDDPSRPALDVQGLSGATLWTNDRRVDLTAVAGDGQTGIGRLQAEIRAPTGTRALSLGTWKPDLKHVVPRGFATPPLVTDRSTTRSFNAALAGRTTVVVRATNGAGLTTTGRGTVRVDRDKPTITWPRKIKPGAVVRLRDRLSGFGTATLTVGEAEVAGCRVGARACELRIPSGTPARTTVSVSVRDQAGNGRNAGRRTVAGLRGPKTPSPKSSSSFLVYPSPNVSLWAGPLRFRWNRPAKLKGALWYRLELDGDPVYEGRGLQHEEYGVELGEHRWRVLVSRSKRGPSIKRAERRFAMVEYGATGGMPTDTDEGAVPVAQTRSGAFEQARRDPVPVDGKAALDLGRRFAPWIRFDSKERWRPVRVASFLGLESRQLLCYRASCANRVRTSRLPNRYDRLDLLSPGMQGDGAYKVQRTCPYGKDGYECAREQPVYYAIRYDPARREYAISYWWFYRYNDGQAAFLRTGDHEGDWEGVNVYVAADTKSVRHVVFDQHGKPSRRDVRRHEWHGQHVGVFPAKGRHASYAWRGRGRDHIPEGDFTEIHKGQKGWWGNKKLGCGGRTCVHLLPTTRRRSLVEAPRPAGPWASFEGKWGAKGPSTPGRGGNEQRLVDPVGYLFRTFRSPRRAGRRASSASRPLNADADACRPLWGGGAVLVACGENLGGPLGTVSIEGRDEKVRATSAFTRVEGSTEADIIAAAISTGESVVVSGPTAARVGILMLISGPGREPYVAVGSVPQLRPGETWTIRVARNTLGEVVANAPSGTLALTPGLEPMARRATALWTKRGQAHLYSAGYPTRARAYRAYDSRGRLLRRRPAVRSGSILRNGYDIVKLRLPARTVFVEARDRRSQKRYFVVAANQVLRDVIRPEGQTSGTAESDQPVRPTG